MSSAAVHPANAGEDVARHSSPRVRTARPDRPSTERARSGSLDARDRRNHKHMMRRQASVGVPEGSLSLGLGRHSFASRNSNGSAPTHRSTRSQDPLSRVRDAKKMLADRGRVASFILEAEAREWDETAEDAPVDDADPVRVAPEDEQLIKRRLIDGKEQGRKLRNRIQAPTLLVGGIAFLFAAAAYLALLAAGSALRFVAAVVVIPVIFIIILALMPTDTRTVHVFAALLLSACAALIVLYFMWALSKHADARAQGCAPMSAGALDECWLLQFDGWLDVGFVLLTFAGLLRVVIAICRRLPTRSVLREIWLLFSTLMFVWCLLITAELLVLGALGRLVADVPTVAQGVVCIETFFLGLVSSFDSTRMRAQSWLVSRGEAVSTAASIAALIGNRSVEVVQEEAAKRLRAVRLDLVAFDDFKSNEPDERLYARSQPAHIGEIDAFISHSWHSDVELKWCMLQGWREEFVRRHSREPLCWIDRWCIDQTDIDAQLMCLPVFLASCSTLLILFEPTWPRRLWCVTELFVFLQMGGKSDRIEMRIPSVSMQNASASPVVDADAYDELEQLEQQEQQPAFDIDAIIDCFDVRAAQCFRRAERDRLMNILEVGFGGLDAFNQVATEMLQIAATNAAVAATAALTHTPENIKRIISDLKTERSRVHNSLRESWGDFSHLASSGGRLRTTRLGSDALSTSGGALGGASTPPGTSARPRWSPPGLTMSASCSQLRRSDAPSNQPLSRCGSVSVLESRTDAQGQCGESGMARGVVPSAPSPGRAHAFRESGELRDLVAEEVDEVEAIGEGEPTALGPSHEESEGHGHSLPKA